MIVDMSPGHRVSPSKGGATWQVTITKSAIPKEKTLAGVCLSLLGASPLVPTDTPPPFSSRLSRCSHLDCRAALTINADHSVGACQAELKLVQKAMLDIPILLREVLTLRTIEELSQAETAAILGVSEKTVETRLYRARARLKKVLDETEA